jgi:hypothetical protein
VQTGGIGKEGEFALKRREDLSFPSTEDELRAPVLGLFPRERYFCKNEVPFGLKRIDMLFRQKNGDRVVIAVELKVTKWRKAIWQAASNCQIATYSYVALPSRTAVTIDRQLMISLGVGLIIAESADEARVDLPAIRSQYVNSRIAEELSNLLAG